MTGLMSAAEIVTKRLHLPEGGGPWSWRRFVSESDAGTFHNRVPAGSPPPVQLSEAHIAPDGSLLPAGTWLVIYRPIIVSD
jgi:hypothetical protein